MTMMVISNEDDGDNEGGDCAGDRDSCTKS